MRRLSFLLGLLAVLTIVCAMCGCSNKPELSELFQDQLTRFMEDGTKLSAMTEQGVSYLEFREQLASVKASWELVWDTWPDGFAPDSRLGMDKSFDAWDWVLYLWELKIGEKDNPVAPSINRYDDIISFAGEDNLVLDTHPYNYIVDAYRGKNFLPFDENIGVMMSMASANYRMWRTAMLSKLE